MAKKQLNLDMPLLSVRRLPSKLSSSSSSDEQKSYPRNSSSSRQSSLNNNLYTPESDLTQFSKPAAVPFLWEQIPGRPKEEQSDSCPVESRKSTPPRLPPGRRHVERRLMKSQVSASFPYDLSVLEIENDSIQEIYSDALETLSATESFDCSLSRISGNAERRRSIRTSLSDSQTRDFMMRRFLPAAKAMVIDTPTQYVSQKHSGQLIDQPNKIDEERITLIKQNQPVKDSETEVDDQDLIEDCVDAIKKPAKIRGILARFCLRNSLCLLNPGGGMKSRKHEQHNTSSPAQEVVSRMSRRSHSGPLPLLPLNNPRCSKSHEFPVPNKQSASRANRSSFSGEMLMRGESSQSTFRGGNGFVSVHKPSAAPKTTPSFEKMFGLDHHPLSIMRLSQLEKKKKKVNECYTNYEIEEEMFSHDWNINSKHSVAVEDNDNEKTKNQLGSLGGQIEADLKSSSNEVQDETMVSSPLTPPLPKSPSESWLWLSLPSISLKSPFHSHAKKHNSKLSCSSPKWENIVKINNKRHDHTRYSEELIPRISQHSKA